MSAWRFLTTCVNVGSENLPKLMECIEKRRDVSYRTFRTALGGAALDEWAESMGYAPASRLHLSRDWAVRFCRSTWGGAPCLVIDWSGIEHVWVRA